MSDTPDIVLNEFGDLSRKARRELEARGIDPDTAVVEYIAATGQMPIITEEQAAAAKAQAQAEAAAATRNVDEDAFASVQSTESEPAVFEDTLVSAPVVEVINEPALETSSIPPVPPVSVAVTSAETGPIEPLVTAPALDSGSLNAVEETLAAVTDQTGEIVTGFDALVTVDTTDVETGPSKGEARRLARKEKKAQALAARAEKAAQKDALKEEAAQAALVLAAAESQAAADAAETAEKARLEAEAEAAAAEKAQREQEESAAAQRIADELLAQAQAEEAARLQEEALQLSNEKVVEEAEVREYESEILDEEDELEQELEPQTISEATAAIAIAEAVAAAEAVVEAGEISIEYGNLSNAVPATTGSISIIPNALILPSLPETTGSIAPILPTGEIVITGSILIPSAVSQTGALEAIDTSEIDVIGDDEQPAPTQSMAPVSAASAVSAYNISNSVVTTPRGMNERLPFILSVTAAGLAVGVVALFVAGYFLGLF